MAQDATDTVNTFSIRATYYSDIFVGRRTANGEIFQQDKYTAAHKTLPFGTLVLVTNPKNNNRIIVRVNDRCPRHGILDLSKRAAKALGIGAQTVQARILPKRYEATWQEQHHANKKNNRNALAESIEEVAQAYPDTSTETPVPAPTPKATKEKSTRPHNRQRVAKQQAPAKARPASQKKADSRQKPGAHETSPKQQPVKKEQTKQNTTTGTEHFTSQERWPKHVPRDRSYKAIDTSSYYQLVLGEAENRQEADLLISRMPMKYQGIISLRPSNKSSHVRMILDMRMTEKEAETVKKELEGLFPESKVRKANNYK